MKSLEMHFALLWARGQTFSKPKKKKIAATCQRDCGSRVGQELVEKQWT